MAFKVSVQSLPSTVVDGRRHRAWLIKEMGSPLPGEPGWVLENLPPFYAISLFEFSVVKAGVPGTATPELRIPALSGDGLQTIAVFPDSPQRLQPQLPRVTEPCRRLFGFSNAAPPDPDPDPQLPLVTFTRITIVDGHAL